jgi:flavodoxin
MSKKILVIYFSQSGQLGDIIQSLTAPLAAAGNTIETLHVEPLSPYPFPWKGKSFFAVMPDSVLGVPTQLQPFELKEKAYDLVIFGYQPWFLSPSIPANSILNHPVIKNILKNTAVVTVTGARNMWISALERIREKLKELGAKQVGNIALVDKHANPVSVVTILYWMFTGKRDRYLNIFPKPGVSDADVASCKVFGEIIQQHLVKENYEGMQDELLAQKAVEVKYSLMFIESKARRIFAIWANFIAGRKKRTGWLVAFKYYLIIALFIAAPIILTVDAIFFKPFLAARIKRQKQYYSGVN